MENVQQQFMTVAQAAREYPLTEAAIRNRIARGVLPARKVGYATLLLREDVERALARRAAR